MKRLLSICHQMHHGWQIRSWQRWTRPILWALPFMWHFTPPSVKMLLGFTRPFTLESVGSMCQLFFSPPSYYMRKDNEQPKRSYVKYHTGTAHDVLQHICMVIQEAENAPKCQTWLGSLFLKTLREGTFISKTKMVRWRTIFSAIKVFRKSLKKLT